MSKLYDWICPQCENDEFDVEVDYTADWGVSLTASCNGCNFSADADIQITEFEYCKSDWNIKKDDEEDE